MSSRADRIAENEVAFRALNERISEWPEHQGATARIVFVCECGDDTCFERLSLNRAEYEAVRADPRYFAVVPGHEKPEVESVVERHAGYFVVQKNEATRSIVEDTDPRSP
jgi:hypothetical protein